MDFLDPKKKKARSRQLFLSYVLMGIALVLATYIIAYQTFGIVFDPKTGAVIENGLIFVDAHPLAADIVLDGVQKGSTDGRFVVPAGEHTVELKRDGYLPWKRTFTLAGGQVERLIYPFLIPSQLNTVDTQLFQTPPAYISQSPDRRWIVAGSPTNPAIFEVTDLSDSKLIQTTLTLPVDTLTLDGERHSWQVIEWSTDNRHLLVRHDFNGGSEFIIIDRSASANSFNLSKLLGSKPFAISLKDKKFDQYYLLDQQDGILRSMDIKSKTPVVIANQVVGYKSHGNNLVLYLTKESATSDNVALKLWNEGETSEIRKLSAGQKYFIDVARYDGRWYMAAGSDKESKVYIYQDLPTAVKRSHGQTIIPTSVMKASSAMQQLAFSSTAQFLSLQFGKDFVVYDNEKDRQYSFTLPLKNSSANIARWMDGHRLLLTDDSKVVVVDYDGLNLHYTSVANDIQKTFFDRDYNNLYAVAPSVIVPGHEALTLTPMRILPK